MCGHLENCQIGALYAVFHLYSVIRQQEKELFYCGGPGGKKNPQKHLCAVPRPGKVHVSLILLCVGEILKRHNY
jgi:hypothetical protein